MVSRMDLRKCKGSGSTTTVHMKISIRSTKNTACHCNIFYVFCVCCVENEEILRRVACLFSTSRAKQANLARSLHVTFYIFLVPPNWDFSGLTFGLDSWVPKYAFASNTQTCAGK
jgi:hypothetical protein